MIAVIRCFALEIAVCAGIGFTVPHTAGIGKRAQAHGAGIFHARHWKQQFGRHIGFFIAAIADHIAVIVIHFGAERAALVTAHRAQAAAVEVFEKRQIFGFAVTVGITHLAAQHQGEIFAQREKPGLVVGEAVVLQLAAGQADFAVYPGDVAAGRPHGTVGFITAPADAAFVNPAFKFAAAACCALISICICSNTVSIVETAILFNKITVAFWRILIDIHRHIFGTQAEIHAVIFRYRHAHTQAAAQ